MEQWKYCPACDCFWKPTMDGYTQSVGVLLDEPQELCPSHKEHDIAAPRGWDKVEPGV